MSTQIPVNEIVFHGPRLTVPGKYEVLAGHNLVLTLKTGTVIEYKITDSFPVIDDDYPDGYWLVTLAQGVDAADAEKFLADMTK